MKPLLGRTFLPGEEQDGRNNVAVLSYEVWQQNFGGNPSVVGSSVHIDGFPYTIVGVMPAGFRFPLGMPNLIYTPLRISKELRTVAWRSLAAGHRTSEARADRRSKRRPT